MTRKEFVMGKKTGDRFEVLVEHCYYKCNICGNEVDVINSRENPVCCGVDMEREGGQGSF